MPIDKPSYDIVIVGAGFSGINLLYSLRKLDYRRRINKSGTDLGRVWHWHTYPGCRIDTLGFIYQLSIPEVSETWSSKEKYPSANKLRAYFAHVDPGAWDQAGHRLRDDRDWGLASSGFLDQPSPHATFEVTAEKREALFEEVYDRGVFAFLLSRYNVLLRDLLAPLEPPHPIGANRSCFEQDYFEMFKSPNVELVNLREAGRVTAAIKSNGIKTQDGGFYPVDAIALATGFNSFTGSLTRISRLRNTSGTTLADEGSRGIDPRV
ncbi:hypothetical protein BO86DRAFT_397101 [Aspergillus japonicus CBS 114.51]|uniref:FAD/NAD(P)-binding domain-containing protein n=2 Tax=Aspergillus TaxID=5052 RepID=A0A2V5GPY6_ASPV1|nr:hypothetical protein BO86DRAFT_397101 [Aspergillus japonicus CBS 114.51]PYI12938.1 hypothetical protein BO99DRAFT_438688 [Aspergillus violaceofuscus CBS 115571]RAH84236.1 hypothetical protein BO86DRAFT_397101 [Aspergillus japonicus CBS 114.51]